LVSWLRPTIERLGGGARAPPAAITIDAVLAPKEETMSDEQAQAHVEIAFDWMNATQAVRENRLSLGALIDQTLEQEDS
jgi:hypothetical protein